MTIIPVCFLTWGPHVHFVLVPANDTAKAEWVAIYCRTAAWKVIAFLLPVSESSHSGTQAFGAFGTNIQAFVPGYCINSEEQTVWVWALRISHALRGPLRVHQPRPSPFHTPGLTQNHWKQLSWRSQQCSELISEELSTLVAKIMSFVKFL